MVETHNLLNSPVSANGFQGWRIFS